MARDDVFQRLRILLGEVCDVEPEEVLESARLSGYGIDSIRVLELMFRAEEEFGLQLELEQLADLKTMGQLVDYVHNLPNPTQNAADGRTMPE